MKKHITVVGAGMGAIAAIRTLRHLDNDSEITVIAPSQLFVYNPSLIWLPTGRRQIAQLSIDLTRFFKRHRVNFIAASVSAIKQGGRCVEHSAGVSHNDGLIIAAGARAIKKLPGIDHAYLACADSEKLMTLQRKLSQMSGGKIAFGFAGNPNEATAMRGGPIFEMLFGIDNFLRAQGRRQAFEISFFSPAAEPGKRLGSQALALIFDQMKVRDITTYLGQKISHFDADAVVTEQQKIAADLVIFQPGLCGPDFAAQSELPLTSGGFIRADASCRVEGFDHTYVIGDAGVYDNSDWYPKQGHMADRHGVVAAQNLVANWRGQGGTQTVAPELLCIIDMHNDAILVKRRGDAASARHHRFYHWAKIAFERYYLTRLRWGF